MKRSLFALFAVLFLLCSCGRSEDTMYVEAEPFDVFLVHGTDDGVEILTNDGVAAVIEDVDYLFSLKCYGGRAAAILVRPKEVDETSGEYNQHSLYYYKDELIHVADGMDDYLLSPDGNSIIYTVITDPPEVNYIDTLYDMFLWKNGKSTFIVSNKAKSGMVFTADSKAFCYGIGDNEDTSYDWYYYNGGEPIFALSDTVLKEASDDGKLYYGYADNNFIVQTGFDGDRQILAENPDDIFYSSDASQVLYNTYDGLFISIEGAEPIMISASPMEEFLLNRQHFDGVGRPDCDDFAGQFFTTSANSIYRITDDYKAELIADFAKHPYMSEDGKIITYYTAENLCLSIVSFNTDNKKIIEKTTFEDTFESDLYTFTVSEDAKTSYYVNDDKELFAVKDGKRTFITSEDEHDKRFEKFLVYNNDKLYYFFYGDNVLYRFDGEKTAAVKTSTGGITSIHFPDDGGFYLHTEDNSYYTFDGVNFVER